MDLEPKGIVNMVRPGGGVENDSGSGNRGNSSGNGHRRRNGAAFSIHISVTILVLK